MRDSGVGFDRQCADKLLRLFHGLRGPGQSLGTGVGLAIVQRVGRRDGCRVRAGGKPEEAARFGCAFFAEGADG